MLTSLPEKQDVWKLVSVGLALTCIFLLTTFQLVDTVLPLEGEERGISKAMIGLITGMYDVGILLGSLFLPQLLSKFALKTGIVAGVSFSSINCILLSMVSFSKSKQLFVIFCTIFRFLLAFGNCTIYYSSVPKCTQIYPRQRSKIVAFSTTALCLANMVGPIFISYMYALGGFLLPFAILGFLGIVTLVLIQLLMLRDNSSENDTEVEPLTSKLSDRKISTGDVKTISEKTLSILDMLKSPPMLIVSVPVVLICSISGTLSVFLTPYLVYQVGIPEAQVGFYFALRAFTGAITTAMTGFLSHKGYNWSVYIGSTLIALFGCILTLFTLRFHINHMGLEIFFILIFLCCFGIAQPCCFSAAWLILQKLVEKLEPDVDEAQYGRIVAAWMKNCNNVGTAIGSIFIGGVVFEIFGDVATFCLQTYYLMVASVVAFLTYFLLNHINVNE